MNEHNENHGFNSTALDAEEASERAALAEVNKAGLIVAKQTPQVEFEDGAEDDFLYGENEAGESLKGQSLAARAHAPQAVEFKTMGEKHKCEVIFSKATFAARRAADDIAEDISARMGVLDPEEQPEEALKVNRAIESDLGYQKARVELALQVTTVDSKGRRRISVPILRELSATELAKLIASPPPEKEIEANYVRAYVVEVGKAVRNFFNPSPSTSTT